MGQIFLLGLADGVNPFAIVTLLIFVGILGVWGKTYWFGFFIGIFFILPVFLTNLNILMGGYDQFWDDPRRQPFIQLTAAILSFLFIGIAGREIKSWIRFQKTKNLSDLLVGRLSFFQDVLSESVKLKQPRFKMIWRFLLNVLKLLLFSCMAAWLTIVGQLWPRDYYLLTPFYLIHAGKNVQLAALVFLMYSLGYVFILVAVWLVVLRVYRSKKTKEFFTKKASLISMSCSGLMFALGGGIVYVLLIPNK